MSSRVYASSLVLLILAACVACKPLQEAQEMDDTFEEYFESLPRGLLVDAKADDSRPLTEQDWTELFEFYNDTLSALHGLKDVWSKPFDDLYEHLRRNNTGVRLLSEAQVAELGRDYADKSRDALERIDDELREFGEVVEKTRRHMQAGNLEHPDRYVFGMAWVLSEELAAFQLVVGNVLREAENVAEQLQDEQQQQQQHQQISTTISPYAVSVMYPEQMEMGTETDEQETATATTTTLTSIMNEEEMLDE